MFFTFNWLIYCINTDLLFNSRAGRNETEKKLTTYLLIFVLKIALFLFCFVIFPDFVSINIDLKLFFIACL